MIAGYSDFKMKAEERQWNMCTDAERPQEDKKCKSKAVWRRQGSRKRARDGKKRLRRCKMWRCNTDAFTHRRSYAETFLHTDAFTYTDAFTRIHLLHTYTFLRIHFHTDGFTNRHSDAFTLKHFSTQTFLHNTLLHTDVFTHRHFYTDDQTLRHTDVFTHSPL